MLKKVPLKDFFEGTCKYSWCVHNEQGYCDVDYDIEHYREIIEGVSNNFGTDKGTFSCHCFDTYDYICENCGSELSKKIDMTDPLYPRYGCECPNCG